MKRDVPWLAAVLFVGCLTLGILALWQRTEISRATQAGVAAGKEAQLRIASLQGELGTLKASKEQAEKKIAQMTQDPNSSQNSQGNNGSNVIHISQILKEHPEYMALYEKQMRRNIDRTYGNGLATLGLPPEQLAQLKNLLVERQMGATDAEQAALAAGLVQGTPAWQTAMQQASQDLDSQIQSIMGSNAEGTLQQLRVRQYIQNQVQNSYAPDFADAGAPLNPEQTNGLIQAMADANYSGKDISTRPADYNITDAVTGLSPHDDRIINNATPVLTPAQVQLLSKDQAENEQIAAIMKSYNTPGKPVMIVP
jgi:hypothetical protein